MSSAAWSRVPDPLNHMLGVDANERLDIPLLQRDEREYVLRYLSDDGFDRNLTYEEAMAYADAGIMVGTFWQNGHSEEIWEGRDGRDVADVARRQQRERGGFGEIIPFTVDKLTVNRGTWPDVCPIGPVITHFEQINMAMHVSRVWGYGTRFTLNALFSRGLISGGIQTTLFDRFYANPLLRALYSRQHPLAWGRQYENADLTGGEHYGAQGYVCYDTGFTRLRSPLWFPRSV